MSDDRYERVPFRGHTLNRWTRAALLSAEDQLGYELHIAQGSYSDGSLSAGTHSGGGAIDVTTTQGWDRAVLVLRQNGFAAWHRTPAQGPWGDHIHGVLIGDQSASASALRQVEAYRDGRNGLAGNGPDDGPRVSIREFPYGEDWFEMFTEEDLRRIVREEVREELKAMLRDDSDGPPNIGRARIERPSGKTTLTVGHVVDALVK